LHPPNVAQPRQSESPESEERAARVRRMQSAAPAPARDTHFFIGVELHSSPLEIFAHLAVKIALNNVSTATMGKLGRLSGNWMAHVDASNKKLIDRSARLVSELAGVDYATACYALFESMDEMSSWSEARRKTVSPAAYTVGRLREGRG